jgi:Zn-dependent M28 family amino/carboxypeptidase
VKKLALSALILAIPLAAAVWIKQPFNHEISAGKLTLKPQVDADNLKKDVTYLSVNLANRHFDDAKTLNLAADFIKNEFAKNSERTSLQSYEINHETFSNVIAQFGPKNNAKPIIIGAHYDAHENTMGADDNASGVAGLLELARIFAKNPPNIPVELVAYTLEEPPNFRTENMGSRHHADTLVKDGVTPKLVIVLEMIGYFNDAPKSQEYPLNALKWLYPDTGNFIAVVGNFSGANETKLVKSVMASSTALPVQSISAPASMTGIDFSDHASYWRHNMPAVMITDTSFYRNANYHKSTDTPETLDYTRMANVVQGVYSLVVYLEPQVANTTF